MRKSGGGARCGGKRADCDEGGDAPDAVKHGLLAQKLGDAHVGERVHLVQDDLGLRRTRMFGGETRARDKNKRNAHHRGRVKEISCHEKPIM
jgi:hypothetical protein